MAEPTVASITAAEPPGDDHASSPEGAPLERRRLKRDRAAVNTDENKNVSGTKYYFIDNEAYTRGLGSSNTAIPSEPEQYDKSKNVFDAEPRI
ncbi:hypothetical protein Pcinc_015709 [Petrolisthes cinctipes]|uniref:Uncharacterized protein n=1 Tax=Petrolisthes cinctipes TaxID=88211 RepID=A0AAE1FSQ0_PETCI|nr:hypothetical protein Pcinc_015709 [Petrolisthes cinctipes]